MHSSNAPQSFINRLQESYLSLKTNPFYKIQYKNVRGLKVRKFPYSLFFIVNEDERIVKILACFHNKRNPKEGVRY